MANLLAKGSSQVKAVGPGRGPTRGATRATPGSFGVLTPDHLLSLQRFAGNRAVCSLMRHDANGKSAPTPVQRLSFRATKWEDATSARVSEGGRGGVIFVDDGISPLVVKSGEPFTVEAEIAASVLSGATTGKSGNWGATTPEARSPGASEAKRMHGKMSELLQPEMTKDTSADPDAQYHQGRTVRLVNKLEKNEGVTVYGFVKGKELAGLLSKSKQTAKKGFLGLKRGLREGTMADRLMNDPGLATMLGRASAADIFLGNSDRLIGKINLENVLVDMDAKEISLIDNVEAGNFSMLRDMPEFDEKALKGFKAWASTTVRKQVAGGQYQAATNTFLDNLRDWFQQAQNVRKQDVKALQKSLDKRRADVSQWFTAGLSEGTLAIKKGLLEGAISMTADIDPSKREQVAANLLARGYFLDGMGVDQAWKEGNELAHLLVGDIVMPKLPSIPKVGA